MSDKFFLDTNILVYTFDGRSPDKKARSLSLVADALQKGTGMISWQVIQEFLNVATCKFQIPLNPSDAKEYLNKVLYPLCQIFPDLDLYQYALDIQESLRFGYYDALIISAALRGGCSILYSEDLQAGQQVQGVRILNPFQP
jgi:predicted nucleic acid-binding protein